MDLAWPGDGRHSKIVKGARSRRDSHREMGSNGCPGYMCDPRVHCEPSLEYDLAARSARSCRSMLARLHRQRHRFEASCGHSMPAGSHVREKITISLNIAGLHRLKVLLAFAWLTRIVPSEFTYSNISFNTDETISGGGRRTMRARAVVSRSSGKYPPGTSTGSPWFMSAI